MSILVTGSIANDHLMAFPGRFREQFVDGRLDEISLSFLVDELEIRRGGVAANIAFGMGRLGLSPVLVGAVGSDFAEYRQWLERHGVDCSGVRVSTTAHTARFQCTTDADQNQIASFYAGAMTEAREIELAPIVEALPGGSSSLGMVLISPNDPEAMIRHSEECRSRGYPFASDVSQQVARMDGEQIRSLVEGASLLFTNAYERSVLEQKTGWSKEDVLARVGISLTTQGEKGVIIERAGEEPIAVPAGIARSIAEPTGVGDAFRAGFLAGTTWQLSLERAAQFGAVLATLVIETVGTQEYALDPTDFCTRFKEAYGEEAVAEIESVWLPVLDARDAAMTTAEEK
ncbi:carbohydrate kinase family protein [Pseudonocardia asaccharolytica]|uniref:Kinase n=1 Tax=Pseudonocardia asaccharolytica DSM 44247 = NBRC 16224 TaxID=1123024 RepID=A0A511D6P6_9PSEU|nr:carbohydrate kinase family protein [Pseudonocardia asaccharolytica]GEL20466.1 kinase [Pseudonocardia asaccharolytica DSM 44247 = NBRC 16224]